MEELKIQTVLISRKFNRKSQYEKNATIVYIFPYTFAKNSIDLLKWKP